ncbi:ATPase domain-containing protein [Natronomonas sp. EA1]|uniref:ATPase domain-containing protein n=1 Tax=Natronomonas sp. EA1 TaxID=3421655 RepID=UPI003EC1418B
MDSDSEYRRVSSGTPGLDEVLDGGLIRGQTTILSGGPGTGKTVLALQFLAAADGDGLYIGFEEREEDLRRNAESLGIDTSNITILDLSPREGEFFAERTYTVLSPDEAEGGDILERISTAISETAPNRLVIDPLSELRDLLPDGFQFRRNITSFINELKEREITTICTTQPRTGTGAADLEYLGDATVELERTVNNRTLEVTKFRGSSSAFGKHTYRIEDGVGGLVYPKLVPSEHEREVPREQLSTNDPRLDALLGGGLERGSVTVLSGPSGVGKSTLASVLLKAAAERGDTPVGFLFEELKSDFVQRSVDLDISLTGHVETGALLLDEVEALTQSPDEFAKRVRQLVEEEGVEFLVLDGIPGYRQGLRGDGSEAELTRELHALCRYLKRMGVTTVLIEEVARITGNLSATDREISYLADNIVFLRYIEVEGSIEKATGVLKKRYSGFERSMRELSIDSDGVHIGERLTGLRGVLTGIPDTTERRP